MAPTGSGGLVREAMTAAKSRLRPAHHQSVPVLTEQGAKMADQLLVTAGTVRNGAPWYQG